MSDEASSAWRQIRDEGIGDGKLEVPTLPAEVDSGFGPVMFATGERGEPRLLVPLGPGKRDFEIEPGLNLKVIPMVYHLNGRRTLFLDITATDTRLEKVFAELVGEILARLENGVAPETAVFSTIADFRDLLKEDLLSGVSKEKILGLLGELYVFTQTAGCTAGDIGAWSGPRGQRHDFRRGNLALEVKTSGRSDATQVGIHGIDQLTAPEGGELYLAHIKFEESAGGAISLAGLYHAVLANGVQKAEIDTTLELCGCRDVHAQEWNESQWALEGVDFYRVEGSFPRLSADAFADPDSLSGVRDITYKIDLSMAGDWRLSLTEADSVLARL
ncbi:PD-(D/E)XK motif protein [Granulosicoccaceae sp. 1_MG-2023]|nr:PD-(D/E)XK motif protein [Granulosicoccaceae sp. 1_MG-2023]